MNRPTLLAVRVLAILLVAVGVIWILQGINVLPGSFMTGQIRWAYRGGIAAVAGVTLLLLTMRGRR
jgi:hypothetical protein